MNRVARHETVFDDDQTRGSFLSLLADLPSRIGVRVHGNALMPNHHHLLVESVLGELPRAMRHLGGGFSRRLNRAYCWDGPLFRGRNRNRLVGSEEYWRHLLLYVHANPVRAGLAHDTTRDVADALAAVGAATGLSLDEIRATRRGGVPSPGNWLAAWWMSRYCGIPHGEGVAGSATRHDALSRVIRRVEQRRHTVPTLAGWIAKLHGDLCTTRGQ